MNSGPILAIETSSRQASIALASDRGDITTTTIDSQIGASAALLPAIRELLAGRGVALRDIGIVAYSHGPGSFTGLRIAATVARMFALAHATRIIAVPTLEVVARNALRLPDLPAHIAVMLDAKREQVFAAAYRIARRDESTREPMLESLDDGPALRDPAAWLASLPRPLTVLGEGVEKQREPCERAGATLLDREFAMPLAANVIHIAQRMAAAGHFCPPDRVTPLYIRPPECEEVYESRRAAAIAKRTAQAEGRP